MAELKSYIKIEINRDPDSLELESAYQMGYDSVESGPNEINCHFSLFSTPEKAKEWEQGRKDAKSISG